MPSYTESSPDLWTKYLNSLLIVDDNYCEESIPLVLNSFGGKYEDIPDLIWNLGWNYEVETLLPHFLKGLSSSNKYTRVFTLCCMESTSFDDEIFVYGDLINSIVQCIDDPFEAVREHAICMLEDLERGGIYDSLKHKEFIRHCYMKETDKQVKSQYSNVPDSLEAVLDLLPDREVAHLPIEWSYTPWEEVHKDK